MCASRTRASLRAKYAGALKHTHAIHVHTHPTTPIETRPLSATHACTLLDTGRTNRHRGLMMRHVGDGMDCLITMMIYSRLRDRLLFEKNEYPVPIHFVHSTVCACVRVSVQIPFRCLHSSRIQGGRTRRWISVVIWRTGASMCTWLPERAFVRLHFEAEASHTLLERMRSRVGRRVSRVARSREVSRKKKMVPSSRGLNADTVGARYSTPRHNNKCSSTFRNNQCAGHPKFEYGSSGHHTVRCGTIAWSGDSRGACVAR